MSYRQVLGNSPIEVVDYTEGELPATFEYLWVVNTFQSKKQNKEVGDFVPHCMVYHLGGDMTPHKVNPNDPRDKWINKYPNQWKAFVEGVKQPSDGAPLQIWSAITPSMKRELNNLNIFTVEDLVNAPDDVIQAIKIGGSGLRESAKKWLADYTGVDRKVEQLTKENEELKQRLDALERGVEKPAIVTKAKKRGWPKGKARNGVKTNESIIDNANGGK